MSKPGVPSRTTISCASSNGGEVIASGQARSARIFDYVTQDAPHYARKVARDIAAGTGILDEFARIGKMTPEIGDEDLPELAICT